MKHKRIYSLIAILISLSSVAQNWDAFNKNYRYNYTYDNNALITNVLFTDSIKQIGNDTAYYMNRIGVECTGTCPTITVAITTTASVIVPNMPQFLQRSIIKYANGLVMLIDTAKLIIKPDCSLNETWLFDSLNTKIAQCIAINTQSVFSIVDSIKTILIDGTDTLKLSKQFGIIQFPDLYNKNKYYRLVGIENKSSYDQTALYGTKVPNAWDFYNFDVGDKFCYHNSSFTFCNNSCGHYTDDIITIEVLNKTILPGIGYDYLVNKIANLKTSGYTPSYSTNVNTYTTITLHYTNTSSSVENKMYPNQVVSMAPFYSPYYPHNIAKYGIDNWGKFYKYYGKSCSTFTNVTIPNINASPAYVQSSNYLINDYTGYASYMNYSLVFGSGLGKVSQIYNNYPPTLSSNCLTGAIKNGSLYLGSDTTIIVAGIEEKNKVEQNIIVYPNPTTGELTIINKENTVTKIELSNYLGQTVLVQGLDESITKLRLQEFKNGIYFLKIYNEEGQVTVKKIIKN